MRGQSSRRPSNVRRASESPRSSGRWSAALLLVVAALLPPAAAADARTESVRTVCDIQGLYAFSPLVGERVTVSGALVTVPVSGGFFLQQSSPCPGLRVSSGLFAEFPKGMFVEVAPGDEVEVTGVVAEVGGETRLRLEQVTIGGTGQSLPEPLVIDQRIRDRTDPGWAERLEGMRVAVAGGMVVGPSDRDGIALITARGERTFREPGKPASTSPIQLDGLREGAGGRVWDQNPEIFALDPDALVEFDRPLPAGTRFGATGVDRLEGVMASVDNRLTLWPTRTPEPVVPRLPVPVRDPAASELRVATLDLDGRWDESWDWDDEPDYLGDPAGHDDLAVGRVADYVCHVLKAPEILALQGVASSSLLAELASVVEAACPGSAYRTYLSPGRVQGGAGGLAFLVAQPVLVVNRLGWEWDDDPEYFDTDPLHIEVKVPRVGELQLLNVQISERHGIELPQIGGELRRRRIRQSIELARTAESLQDIGPLLITGDFASYQFHDGYFHVVAQISGAGGLDVDVAGSIVPIVDPPLANQAFRLDDAGGCTPPAFGPECYDTIEEGNASLHSHMLVSQDLARAVTSLVAGRGLADRPTVGAAEEVLSGRQRAPHRDGLVLYLDPDRIGRETAAAPE